MKIELDLPVPEGLKVSRYSYGQDTAVDECLMMCAMITFERIEPKIDTELEEVRKKFPVGSWLYQHGVKEELFQVTHTPERDDRFTECINIPTKSAMLNAKFCTPCPIPTWRCCESDKPKKDGRYFTRDIDSKGWMKTNLYKNGHWDGECERDEWLDEGER